MKRVLIIGCGGAGKSTLARTLGEKTGLPVVHLDQIYWAPGDWNHLSREAFDTRVAALLEEPAWIMDGNYGRTFPVRLEKCDTVIYLDYNRFVCIFGWLKRVLTHWGKSRPDMGPNCAEWLDPEFLKWIWHYNRDKRAQNYALLNQASHAKVLIFRNRRELCKWLNQI